MEAFAGMGEPTEKAFRSPPRERTPPIGKGTSWAMEAAPGGRSDGGIAGQYPPNTSTATSMLSR
jgi:hypothetical protein